MSFSFHAPLIIGTFIQLDRPHAAPTLLFNSIRATLFSMAGATNHKDNPMFDAVIKASSEISASVRDSGPIPCPHAAIYKDYLTMLQGVANEHMRLVRNYRGEYDYFYDHLQQLPKETREENFPEICAIVDRIEKGACNLSAVREGLTKAFDDAVISKMTEIAVGQAYTAVPTGELYLKAMETLRQWRVTSLDGCDVDMANLLDQREKYSPSKAGLFENVFRTWAKETNPSLPVDVTRLIVLDHLSAAKPEMARNYIATLHLPGVKQFGNKFPGTKVIAEADLEPFA